MPEILVSRQGDKLIPCDELSSEDIQKLGSGPFMVTVKKSRSSVQLRLYWSICQSICQSGGFDDGEAVLHDLTKLSCGMFKLIDLNGLKYRIPDSVSFAKMKQDEFNDYLTRAVSFWKSEGLWSWVKPELRGKIDD